MKGKKILFWTSFFSPEPTGSAPYNAQMTEYLTERGFDCTVVTTYPNYPHWKIQESYKKFRFWYKIDFLQFTNDPSNKVKVIRCPHYIPKNPTGIKRIISDFSFFLSSFFVLIIFLFKKRYDYVVTIAPPFQLGLFAVLYQKIKKAVFLYHIHDLQIDAARDLQIVNAPIFFNILLEIEKFILKNADVVSAISEGMIRKIKEKYDRDVLFFPIWVNTQNFYPLSISNKEKIKEEFGFSFSDKIILYSGSIGEKQGLDNIIHVAKKFIDDSSFKFVICGSGPYKDKLECLAKSAGIANIAFLPLQPAEKFNDFLNIADLHLVIQKASASDLLMPSKLTTILSVGGLALVTANPGSSLYEDVKKHNIGVLVKADDTEALFEGINSAFANNNCDIKKKARNYAEEYLSIGKIFPKLLEKLKVI